MESSADRNMEPHQAGNDLTLANVIKQSNSITSFTADGLTVPINWKAAGHAGHAPPYCGAFIRAKGTKCVPALDISKKSVFVCFGSTSAKAKPGKLPAGTPNG